MKDSVESENSGSEPEMSEEEDDFSGEEDEEARRFEVEFNEGGQEETYINNPGFGELETRLEATKGNLDLGEKAAEVKSSGVNDLECKDVNTKELGLGKMLVDCFGDEVDLENMFDMGAQSVVERMGPGDLDNPGPSTVKLVGLSLNREDPVEKDGQGLEFEVVCETPNLPATGSDELVSQVGEKETDKALSDPSSSQDPFDLKELIWKRNPLAPKKDIAKKEFGEG